MNHRNNNWTSISVATGFDFTPSRSTNLVAPGVQKQDALELLLTAAINGNRLLVIAAGTIQTVFFFNRS